MKKLFITPTLASKLLLTLFVGTVGFNAAACTRWDMACKAKDAANTSAKFAADAANQINGVAKPNPLLVQPFNTQLGPKLITLVEQMTATLVPVTTPAQAAPALARILQIWPMYEQLDKDFTIQLVQIAAHQQVGKKTNDMASVETTVAQNLALKGRAMDAELLRVSKLPLAAADMAMVQNLHKALAE